PSRRLPGRGRSQPRPHRGGQRRAANRSRASRDPPARCTSWCVIRRLARGLPRVRFHHRSTRPPPWLALLHYMGPSSPSEETMIHFACVHCGTKFKVKPELGGRAGKCPTCQGPLTVPQAAGPAKPLPAGKVEGTPSSLHRAGLEVQVTLDSPKGSATG